MESKKKVSIQRGVESGIERVFQKSNYPLFLKYLADMHHYDYYNSLLLFIQRASFKNRRDKEMPTNVAEKCIWEKRNRSIQENANRLLIVAPSDNVLISKTVYDVTQTVGHVEKNENSSYIENRHHFFKQIRSIFNDEGILVLIHPFFDDSQPKMPSYCEIRQKKIVLNSNLKIDEKIRELIYQYAFLKGYQYVKEESLSILNHNRYLFGIATSVTYCFLYFYKFNLNYFSFDYLESWAQQYKNYHQTLNLIQLINQSLIERIEYSYLLAQKEVYEFDEEFRF